MNTVHDHRRCALGSLARFALAVVLALTAFGLGASAGDDEAAKQASLDRLSIIGKELASLRMQASTAHTRTAIARLQREYDRISDSLGGDDPAGLRTSPGNAPARNDDGGLAAAPPAPAGCNTSTVAFNNATAVAIPNNPVQGTPVFSTINVSGVGSFLWDVNLTTFITHSFAADLDITLTSPAGTVVTITTDNGLGNDDVFNGTVWDDDANPAGQVPYTANNGVATDHAYANLALASPLVPEEAMGAFFGENPNGTWTLAISDDTVGDVGTLHQWSLQITSAGSAPATSQTSQTNATPVAIPGGPATVTSVITINGAAAVLTDVNVTTFITHNNNADLDITLQSPEGTVITLTTDNGGSFDNVFNGTVWDDDANPGGTLPQGSNNGVASDHTYVNLTLASPLVPEEALAAFIGENPNGDWTLTISDDAALNGGSLDSWTLNVLSAVSAPATSTAVFSNTNPTGVDQPAPTAVSTILVSGVGAYLWDVDAITSIVHTACGDLDVTIQSPAGTVVTLTSDNGAMFDNVFNGTTWDDDSNPGGALPYTSNSGLASDRTYANLTTATPLAPEEPLGAFIGENPNGTWTISVHDDSAGADSGTLTQWGLSITTLDAVPVNQPEGAFVNATPVTITTGAPPQVFSSTVSVSGAATFLREASVALNVSHTFSSDLDITLTSPAGTIVTLTTDNGAGHDNVFAGTVFDDDADPDGQVPFDFNEGSATDHPYANNITPSSLTPEEPLAAFIGEDPNGTWTLTISDDASGGGGTLNSWSLTLISCECGGTPSCPADTNGDNVVNVADLLAVIAAWGPCPGCPPADCPTDINDDCQINVADLLGVIAAWGACP